MSSTEYSAPGLDRGRPEASSGRRALRAEPLILGGLVLLAAVIRIVVLNNQSIWADEALTAYEARLPLGAMLHTVARVEVTPPLYFIVVWVWAKVFGAGPAALRAVSGLASLALVPIAYGATRELVSRRAGLVAAALMTVNPLAIWYGQEARSYMLLALFTGAAFWAFARALRAPSRRILAAWTLLSVLAVMTHFFAGFAIAPQAVLLVWRHRSRGTALAAAIVAAAQLAMLPFAIADTSASHGTGWIGAVPLSHRISMTVVEWGASNLYRRTNLVGGLATGFVLIAVTAVLLARGSGGKRRRGALIAAAVAICVGLGPLILAAVGQDYFLSRNEIPALVPVVTVLAAACTAPRLARAGAGLAAILLVGFAVAAADVQTHPFLQRANWRAVAAALGPAVRPRAILAANGTTAQPLKIYLRGVSWVQPHGRRVRVSEIDVVGATKRLRLDLSEHPSGAVSFTRPPGGVANSLAPPRPRPRRHGAALPTTVAPPRTRLLARFRVANWVVARFLLARPRWVSVSSLTESAPSFFERTPAALLVFMQPRGS
ncbi:MAG: glycosyltransferase family 39 protein [Actinomycetota bacterium]|nr:glycosyltransferase family 39 protein [Actinomycetota bacterium]